MIVKFISTHYSHLTYMTSLLDAYHLGLGMAYIIIGSQRIVCALNFRDCPVFSWQEYV